MASLDQVVDFCDSRTRRSSIPDFDGAHNGLQVANSGQVRRIGAAVDAGMEPFRLAKEAGVDFLIVHHGIFWDLPVPLTGRHFRKLRCLLEGDCALYSSRLPLDCHPEIGNNAILARTLGVEAEEWILPFQGVPMVLTGRFSGSCDDLLARLERVFPKVLSIASGPACPQRVAFVTGSGGSVLPDLRAHGIDTLITGELKQHHFNLAQEESLNLFVCGHYATETFGVRALAEERSEERRVV